jgi:hypothetical protein
MSPDEYSCRFNNNSFLPIENIFRTQSNYNESPRQDI